MYLWACKFILFCIFNKITSKVKWDVQSILINGTHVIINFDRPWILNKPHPSLGFKLRNVEFPAKFSSVIGKYSPCRYWIIEMGTVQMSSCLLSVSLKDEPLRAQEKIFLSMSCGNLSGFNRSITPFSFSLSFSSLLIKFVYSLTTHKIPYRISTASFLPLSSTRVFPFNRYLFIFFLFHRQKQPLPFLFTVCT